MIVDAQSVNEIGGRGAMVEGGEGSEMIGDAGEGEEGKKVLYGAVVFYPISDILPKRLLQKETWSSSNIPI